MNSGGPSIPAQQRLGLEDDCGFQEEREQPVEPDEDQPISIAQSQLHWGGPFQDEQLLAEK
jgi:hypothetical protein